MASDVEGFLSQHSLSQYTVPLVEAGFSSLEDLRYAALHAPNELESAVPLPGHRSRIARLLAVSSSVGAPPHSNQPQSPYPGTTIHPAPAATPIPGGVADRDRIGGIGSDRRFDRPAPSQDPFATSAGASGGVAADYRGSSVAGDASGYAGYGARRRARHWRSGFPPSFGPHHATPCAVAVLHQVGESVVASLLVDDVDLRREVYHTFMFFCTFGDRDNAGAMTSAMFQKLARELRLFNRTLTPVDLDLIFVKVTKHDGSNSRVLDWDAFLAALHMVAIAKWPRLPSELAARRLLSAVVGREV
eukprot:TRINITY_DN56771_c0_g1_i1.p1 TRINITY_DN56771_c0_g1~~TRINITY_DN56771_c0_g1_i1.p1  ORF type:complete len:303 (-),score=30.26 TRINITY_DN56771_c0_g1_i1:88-996(-)